MATNIIISKTDAELQLALEYLAPDIVLCPEKPTNVVCKWIKTRLFTESIFDENGTWIPEVDARRIQHVANIQSLAIQAALEHAADDILMLAADVTPTPDWQQQLIQAKEVTPSAGLIGGVVPTGMDDNCKSWWIGRKPISLSARFSLMVEPIESTTLDCCLLDKEAAKAIVPLSGDTLTEWEIAMKLGTMSGYKGIYLHTLVQCDHG